MPYNKQSALKNQKDFLKSQAKCGHPNIEKLARQSLAKIEKLEREQKECNERIKAFNKAWEAKRKK